MRYGASFGGVVGIAVLLAGCAGGSNPPPAPNQAPAAAVTVDVPLSSGQQTVIPLAGIGTLAGPIGTVPSGTSLHVVETKSANTSDGAYTLVAALTPSTAAPGNALANLRVIGGISGVVCASAFGWSGALAAAASMGRFCFDNNGARDFVAAQVGQMIAAATLSAGQTYTVQFDVAPAGQNH